MRRKHKGMIFVERAVTSHMNFQDVRKLIRAHGDLSDAIDAADKVLGAILLLSPIALGPTAALPILALFEARNELVRLSKELCEKITRRKRNGYLDQSRALAAAHCVLTFTAFFEALDDEFPSLMKRIKITEKEKQAVAKRALELSQSRGSLSGNIQNTGVDLTETEIGLPHPAAPSAELTQRLALYASMSKSFQKFLEGLVSWEELSASERDAAKTALIRLPGRANAHYDAQYFALVSEYPEFSAWVNLKKHLETQTAVESVAESLEDQSDSLLAINETIDLGFSRVERLIERLPRIAPASNSRAQYAAQALQQVYRDRILEPVIDDQYIDESSSTHLSYPTKADIFVPQAFKVIRHNSPSVRLEDPELWDSAHRDGDLGDFLLSYLESPYSAQYPLLILGHPGSGKSLLTEIISARLKPPFFNTVRVVLRDIDPDDDLQTQIEKQIRADTGEQVSWTEFSSDSRDNPPLVILDGYDELLQANGRVFGSYLTDVQRFQRREATLDRPVRIVVTSRLTLIDKAKIPSGTTAIRLLEFDGERREKWATIWNDHNQTYFSTNNVRPFQTGENPRILNLAEQPLLLLMLALYDSQDNQLSKDPKIDQTRLYHSLLTRFIERERGKETDFLALEPTQQAAQVDQDLERLGVAAVSMFNRQSFHILRDDLERDISYFAVTQEQKSASGVVLTQADLLLGSFFFIHQSRSRSGDPHDDGASRPTAFEFLHNTFGEFLCADFILRQVLRETRTVGTLNDNPQLVSTLQQRLNSVEERWFACLIHTALHTRPVIVAMLREWAAHCLQTDGRSREVFLGELDLIVQRQLRSILIGEAPPTLTHREREVPYQRLALLGHLAIYSLNLIILRSILSPDRFVLDETSLIPDSVLRPWDRLTHLWRSWITVESLAGIGNVIKARRNGSRIIIRPNTTLIAPSNESRLSTIFNVADTLADDILAILAAFQLTQAELRRVGSSLGEYVSRLQVEGVDLSPQAAAYELQFEHSIRPEVMRLVESIVAGERHFTNLEHHQLVLLQNLAEMGRLNVFLDVPVAAGVSPSFLHLSRQEAAVLTRAKDAIEPRWFGTAFTDMVGMNPKDYLSAPAAAPLFRSAARRPGLPFVIRWLRSFEETCLRDSSVFQQVDSETAASIVMIANCYGSDFLREQGLQIIARNLHSGLTRLEFFDADSLTGIADAMRYPNIAGDASLNHTFQRFADETITRNGTVRVDIATVQLYRLASDHLLLGDNRLSVLPRDDYDVHVFLAAVRLLRERYRGDVSSMFTHSHWRPFTEQNRSGLFALRLGTGLPSILSVRELDDLRWFVEGLVGHGVDADQAHELLSLLPRIQPTAELRPGDQVTSSPETRAQIRRRRGK